MEDSASADHPDQPQSEIDLVIGWVNAILDKQFFYAFKGKAQASLNTSIDESMTLEQLCSILVLRPSAMASNVCMSSKHPGGNICGEFAKG